MKTFHLKKNLRSLSKYGLLTIFTAMTAVMAATSEGAQKENKQYADFLPVGISIGCQSDTPASDRLNVERASGISQSILPIECTDRRKFVSHIYPEKIGVIHRNSIDTWNLVLILNKDDASNVNSLSKGNIGKTLLVSVNSKVVAKAILYGPIVGQKIYISVDSEKDGEAMASRFITSPSDQKSEQVRP